jgi:3-hydroxyanthranilate 3,4-dioxygenase
VCTRRSFGLVIERSRADDELDGLRWYSDFDECGTVLWEKYFHCGDLGRDLVPVVMEFKASSEAETKVPGGNVVADAARPWPQDVESVVPDPFPFADFVAAHEAELAAGGTLSLFPDDHPDREFSVVVCGGGQEGTQTVRWKHDTWLYQYRGTADVSVDGKVTTLSEGGCAVVPAGTWYSAARQPGSVGLVVMQDPTGNRGAKGASSNPRPVVEVRA